MLQRCWMSLRQKVLADYKPQYDAVLQQANAKLTRDLGNGFKSREASPRPVSRKLFY